MGCCRFTYNAALAHIKAGKYHKKNLYWLRNRFVTACNVQPAHRFLLDTPKHVRDGACKDLETAYKANFARMKTKPTHRFDIRFRCKKDTQSIVIPKASVRVADGGGILIYPRKHSAAPIRTTSRQRFSEIQHDCRLSRDRTGRWILYVPTEVETFAEITENQGDRICSVDPGVRTFATTWSPRGEAFKIGDGDATRFARHLIHMDGLIGEASKAKGKRGRRLRKALARMRQRHENLMRDFHCQVANYLVKRYDVILLPHFDSKAMASRARRKLTTRTVRSMMGLGHGVFRQRLSDAASRRGVTVTECTEEYTSKTCSRCGWIHPTLGGAKTFKCKACDLRIDRDLQGAFNIYLKTVSPGSPGDFALPLRP